MATRPGAPTTFSSHWQTYAPWSPPGLNTSSPIRGERNLAKVTLPHAMMIAMPKNHFRRFNRGKAPIIRRLQSNRKAGIKKAGMPKQRPIR